MKLNLWLMVNWLTQVAMRLTLSHYRDRRHGTTSTTTAPAVQVDLLTTLDA